MSNVLEAICNISELKIHTVDDIKFSRNRATSVGEGLEKFVKDAFSNSFNSDDVSKMDNYSKVFSYQGNSKTPPDFMLKKGAAVEVKKIENKTSDLQLNSSHPKRKLKSNSTLINTHCKKAEQWKEKDFLYIIGNVLKGELSTLWIIDGSLYAADEEVYLNIKNELTEKIKELENVNFSPTNEIGRINNVDPLGITNLRIRGMWILQSPIKVFKYLNAFDNTCKFQCISILSNTMYNSISNNSKYRIKSNKEIIINDVLIYDPNNPSKKIPSKLIKYSKNLAFKP